MGYTKKTQGEFYDIVDPAIRSINKAIKDFGIIDPEKNISMQWGDDGKLRMNFTSLYDWFPKEELNSEVPVQAS